MSKTALIFGVTGQDGSYLAEHLLGLGYHVIGVRRRTSVPNTGRVDHLAGEPRFKLICGDVTDAASVSQVVWQAWQKACMEWKRSLQTDPKADNTPRLEVYNLAAQSQVKVSFDEPLHTTQATYLGCLNILEAVRRLDVRKEHVRFYQASSSEMFGSAYTVDREDGEGYTEHYQTDYRLERPEEISRKESEPYQDEWTPFLPCSPYAIAKLAAHHAVRLYRDSYGLFACSGILFNHESERRGEEFVTRKITRYAAEFARWKAKVEREETGGVSFDHQVSPDDVSVIRLNRNGEPYGHKDSWLFGPKFPKLRLGNLDASRDWGHAEDYVRAMRLMLQQERADDFVICTGQTHTVREFLLAAFKAAGLEAENVESLPVVIDPALYRPSEVPFLRGDCSKARRVLGWEPKVSFEELVRRMVYSDMDGLPNVLPPGGQP
jgi:GDPmannose 4,6-dehydratase